MTIDAQFAQIPTQVTASDVSRAETTEEALVFIGAWEAHRNYTRQESTAPGVVEIEEAPDTSGRGRIRQAFAARYAVYRLNRQFRRNQREFDQAMDHINHDDAGQRELHMSWTLRP
jgi:hypothetical protein